VAQSLRQNRERVCQNIVTHHMERKRATECKHKFHGECVCGRECVSRNGERERDCENCSHTLYRERECVRIYSHVTWRESVCQNVCASSIERVCVQESACQNEYDGI